MRDFVAIQHSEEMVTSVIWWSDALISFRTTRPADLKYEAGEYARVAFPERHLPTWRAYPFVSSPQSDTLEFFGVIGRRHEATSASTWLQTLPPANAGAVFDRKLLVIAGRIRR